MFLGHNSAWRCGLSVSRTAMPELRLVGLCILPKKRRGSKGVRAGEVGLPSQPWSFFLFIHPCWSLNLRTQALDRMRLQGTPPYPSTLNPFYTFMPVGWTPLLLKLYYRGPAKLAPFLSCKGDPSHLAMGSSSRAKQTPVRTNLDPTPGPGSVSLTGAKWNL